MHCLSDVSWFSFGPTLKVSKFHKQIFLFSSKKRMLQQEFWSSSAKTALLGQMCCKISAKEGLHIKLTLCILPVGSDSGPKVELSYCPHWTYLLWFLSNYNTHSLYHFEKPAIVAIKSDIVTFIHVKLINVKSGFNLITMRKNHQVALPNIKKLIFLDVNG